MEGEQQARDWAAFPAAVSPWSCGAGCQRLCLSFSSKQQCLPLGRGEGLLGGQRADSGCHGCAAMLHVTPLPAVGSQARKGAVNRTILVT